MSTPTAIRRLRAYPATDAGRARAPQNEDSYALPPALTQEQERDKGYLFVLADGMGGYQAGEVASAIVTQVLPAAYYADPDANIPASLERAIASVERQIKADQQAHASHAQMGSTVVTAVVRGNLVVVSNVGDSRCYRLRAGRLKQISIDHSWVGEQVRNKVLTEQEAREHPYRSVLNRALGQPNASSKSDTITQDWQPGDRLLLCSDGLWDMLPDLRIAELLGRPDAAEAAQKLIDEANAAGGEDNITVVIVTDDMSGPLAQAAMAAPAGVGAAASSKTRRIMLPLVAFALVSLCVGSGLLAVVSNPEILGLNGSGGKDGGPASATPAPASAGNRIITETWAAPTATLAPFITTTGASPTKTPTPTKPAPTSTATATATTSPSATATITSSERATPTPTVTPTYVSAERTFGQIEVCKYYKTENRIVRCLNTTELGAKGPQFYILPDLQGLDPNAEVIFRWSAKDYCGIYKSSISDLKDDPHGLTKLNNGKWEVDVFLNGKVMGFVAFEKKEKKLIPDMSRNHPLCSQYEACDNKNCTEWK